MDPLKKHGINGEKMMDAIRFPVIKEEVDPYAGYEPEFILAKDLPASPEREILEWACGPEIEPRAPRRQPPAPAKNLRPPPKADDFELDIEIIEDPDLGYDAADVTVSDHPTLAALSEDVVSWAVDPSLEKQRRHEAFLKELAVAANDTTSAFSTGGSGKSTWWYSRASDPVVGIPGLATITSITAGNQQLQINFTEPSSDGGSAITNYQYSFDGGTTFTDAGTTSSPITITGLTNGLTYNVIIRPVNAVGSGPNSNSSTGTPSTVPDSATITSIVTADGQLTVSFNAPGDDGGSNITDYQVSTDGGSTFTSVGSTTSPFVISSLDTTNSFDVVIQAINENGAGTSSATVSSQAYAVSPAASSVNEGSSLTFNVSTANVANGTTLYWTINNITTADGDFSATSGTVSINSNAGTFSVTAIADSTTEGSQTFTVSLRTTGVSGTVVDTSTTVTVNDTSTTPWSPANDITTVAWIDASDSSNYTTSGATLTGVTDKSGTYTMTVGGTPTVGNTLNGLNVFDFDGSNEYLQSSGYQAQASSGNHWAIGVFRFEGTDSTKDSIWSYETNASPKRDYALSSRASNNTWPGELDLDDIGSGGVDAFNRISSTIGNKKEWTSGLTRNTWHIVACFFNKSGNQIGVRVDGSNAFTPVDDYDNSIQTNQELRLMRNRSSRELDGKLAEFFAVADIPGTGFEDISILEEAEGYLAHRWGLEGSLPADHPYKSDPP